MGMVQEFRDFAVKGNVVDMAVGVIIGGAFGKIVTSIVNDVVMPPIGKLMGNVNFADLFINLDPGKTMADGSKIVSLAQAKQAGASLIIVNREPTPFDYLADVVIHGKTGAVMERIVAEVKREGTV